MYNILRKNHAISIHSTNRMGEEDGRNWEGYKSFRFANWRIQIYRILPPKYWSDNCQQLIVSVDRDYLLTAIIVSLWQYIQWKRKHPKEDINEWEE